MLNYSFSPRRQSPLLFGCLAAVLAQDLGVRAVRETPAEPQQTDDPAIWVHKLKPEQSLVLGTVKAPAPHGAVAVYRLDGTLLARVAGIDRPNNIDVAYAVRCGDGRLVDLAVVTERNRGRLRIFEILPDVGLRDLASIPVFEGETGPAALPMGVALYRDRHGHTYAIVSRKSGPSGRYLWQYRLDPDPGSTRALRGVKVREFGQFSGAKEIEAIAVDQELGYVYYSDEGAGVRKYQADPAHGGAARELALFATGNWQGDREGIAIYAGKNRGGYLIVTEQLHPVSRFHVFPRDGAAQASEIAVFQTASDTTDGIEVSSQGLGPEFPQGLFVAMNDSRHNFQLVDWRSVAAGLPQR